MAKLELKKPFELDGKEVTEIEYDLEALTGRDIESAIAQLSKKGIIVTMAETDQRYQAMLFSIASDMAYEDVNRLSARDFFKATTAVRDFFLE